MYAIICFLFPLASLQDYGVCLWFIAFIILAFHSDGDALVGLSLDDED